MNATAKLLVTTGLFMVVGVSNVEAQRYYSRKQSSFFMGIEANLATQSLKFNSDIDNIKPISALQAGPTFGFIAGTNVLSGKLKEGSLNSSDFGTSPLKLRQLEAAINFNPLQINPRPRHKKHFDVYLTGGASRGSIKLNGLYTPKPEVAPADAAPKCTCTCPLAASAGLLANPDQTTASASTGTALADPDAAPAPAEKKAFSEKLTTDYINVGLGFQVLLRKKQYFANLFAEAKYGMAVNTKTNGEALVNTKPVNQTGVSFGIRFGLAK